MISRTLSRVATAISGRSVRRAVRRWVLGRPGDDGSRPSRKAGRYVWSIGIYAGDAWTSLAPLPGATNPVLTGGSVSDVPARYVADPFMLRVDRVWHMFFEVMNHRTGRGAVGLAASADGRKWTYERIVLAEPFHLSYPYVFEHRGDYYMIPECSTSRSVRLYRARPFPWRWSLAATLLEGPCLLDASVVRYGGKWWLFVETNPELSYDTLRLFYADALTGPWREHPESPIVRGDPRIARPAGRIVVAGDRVVRYAQDCSRAYGTAVHALEVLELTPRSYRERPACPDPILQGSGAGWNESGMHHVDPHALSDGRWVACVDGWYRSEA